MHHHVLSALVLLGLLFLGSCSVPEKHGGILICLGYCETGTTRFVLVTIVTEVEVDKEVEALK